MKLRLRPDPDGWYFDVDLVLDTNIPDTWYVWNEDGYDGYICGGTPWRRVIEWVQNEIRTAA